MIKLKILLLIIILTYSCNTTKSNNEINKKKEISVKELNTLFINNGKKLQKEDVIFF